MPCLISCHVSMPTWLSLPFHFSFGTKKQNKKKKKKGSKTHVEQPALFPLRKIMVESQTMKSLLISRSVSYTLQHCMPKVLILKP